jgi:hypothetical protein
MSRGVLERLVVKPTSIGKPLIEAHIVAGHMPVLFQRLDGELISRGLNKRKIDAEGEILLEDHRYNPPLSMRVNLANLHEQQAFAA